MLSNKLLPTLVTGTFKGDKMKQWQFTSAVIGGAVLLTLLGMSWAFGLNPLMFVWNLLVYTLAVPALLMTVPFFLGYFSPWLIRRGDDSADERRDMPYGWHWLIGPLVSVPIGLFWMKVLIPLVCKLPQLNTWAWEFIRFPANYENAPWGWFAVVAFCYLVGYFVYFAKRNFEY